YDEALGRLAKDLEAVRGVKTESGGFVIPIITPFFFGAMSVPKRTVNVAPIIANLYAMRGYAFLRKGMLDEAIADLREGVEARQESFAGMHLGVAMLEKGDHKEALFQLRKFVELRPTVRPAWVYHAIALKLNGDDAGAQAQFERFERYGRPALNLELKSSYD